MKTLKISVLVTFFLISAANLNGAWYANWPPPPIPTPTGNESNNINYMNNLIVDGASNMLQAYSSFILLINESELSNKGDFNILNAKNILSNVTDKLYTAKEKYSSILYMMNWIKIDKTEIDKLKYFDYYNFTHIKKLHPLIMSKVENYLSNGNLLCFFEGIQKDIEEILISIKTIKDDLDKDIIPGIENLRSLYEKYTDSILFGYYASLVFSEIKKEVL